MARSTAQAVADFTETMQRLVSCLSPDVVQTTRPVAGASSPYTAFVGDLFSGFEIKAETNVGLRLWLRHFYTVRRVDEGRRDHRAETEGYMYALLDRTRRELLAFHDHPSQRISWPHIHVRSSPTAELARAHIPSGRIQLADVIRMLVEDFGAQPQRTDWEGVLRDARARFRTEPTW